MDENNAMELNASNKSGESKVGAIQDSAVYAKESEDYLPELYYLISWKEYPEEENTWEPASTNQHLRKRIRLFHKDHSDKPSSTFVAINTAPSMARPII